MAREATGLARFPDLLTLGPASVIHVSLHTGPVVSTDGGGWAPPTSPFTTGDRVTFTHILAGDLVIDLTGSVPVVRQAEPSYGWDEWPDAEEDEYALRADPTPAGRGDPLAEVRGLSYDQTLAEIDARLRGE